MSTTPPLRASVQHPALPAHVSIASAPPEPKNLVLAAALGILFGPLGLLYVSLSTALWAFAGIIATSVLTGGVAALPSWLACGAFGYFRAKSLNERNGIAPTVPPLAAQTLSPQVAPAPVPWTSPLQPPADPQRVSGVWPGAVAAAPSAAVGNDAAASRFCSACGNRLALTARFCNKCGAAAA